MDSSTTHQDEQRLDLAPKNPQASIIIPAFNEEQALPTTLERLREALKKSDRRYEVVVVDDGSADRTAELVQAAGARLIQHRRNKGYGSALKTGVLNALAEIVVFYDADDQFDPDDIERVVSEMQSAEAVFGNRTTASHSPFSRRGGKKMLGWLANYLARQKIPDLNCGLRAIRRNLLLDYLHLWPAGFSASTTTTLVLIKEGYDVTFVPIVVKKRIGTSTVKFKDGFDTALLMIRLTTLLDPLRVFLPVALALFFGGIGWGLQWLLTGEGLSTAALFLMVSGVMIFFFGLLGDQLSAMRRERRYSDRKR